MPTSILWIAALSGVLVLGGVHLLIWFVLRAHRKSDADPGGDERESGRP